MTVNAVKEIKRVVVTTVTLEIEISFSTLGGNGFDVIEDNIADGVNKWAGDLNITPIHWTSVRKSDGPTEFGNRGYKHFVYHRVYTVKVVIDGDIEKETK